MPAKASAQNRYPYPYRHRDLVGERNAQHDLPSVIDVFGALVNRLDSDCDNRSGSTVKITGWPGNSMVS